MAITISYLMVGVWALRGAMRRINYSCSVTATEDRRTTKYRWGPGSDAYVMTSWNPLTKISLFGSELYKKTGSGCLSRNRVRGQSRFISRRSVSAA